MHSVKLADNKAQYESNFTPSFTVYVDGISTKPSAAVLSMFTPFNQEKVTEGVCTISAVSPYPITYEISSTLMEDYTRNYRLLLKYTIGGVDYEADRIFDVVRFKIECGIIDNDLLKKHPDLQSNLRTGKTSFQDQIEEAFRLVKDELEDFEMEPNDMIDGQQIDDLIIYKTLDLIFTDFTKDKDDIWNYKAEKEREKYAKLLKNIVIRMDVNQDESIDTNKKFSSISVVR